MSWTKSVTLWCDENDCPHHSGSLTQGTVKAARVHATEVLDWTHKNGNDYCPRHG